MIFGVMLMGIFLSTEPSQIVYLIIYLFIVTFNVLEGKEKDKHIFLYMFICVHPIRTGGDIINLETIERIDFIIVKF